MTDRSHLSIGEVLSLLQEEFPDVTISKIRFLESQGLLDPERTPSGYRKFYEDDIARLRWILIQQRENFLPLKVIKDRLAAGELDEPVPSNGSAAQDGEATVAEPTVSSASPPAGDATAASNEAAPSGRRSRVRRRAGQGSLLDTGETSVSLSLDELVAATGLTARSVVELERFGLVNSRTLGSSSYYDEDALVVARLAATFLARGVEPRHLRMYKVAAEREAGVFEQLVMPLLKQRNPAARQEAIDALQELTELGDQLRSAMLRQALREYLGHG
jgi:DNA-binding transcriptional MerR regulator